MQFKIMSRDVCERFAKQKHKNTSVVISIKSSWDKIKPDLDINDVNGIKDILFLSFDDIGIVDTLNSFSSGTNCRSGLITKSDARQIVHFVDIWKDSVDMIIVHCDGGISRSAGVMAAIQRYLLNDDSAIFHLRNKFPNMTCYLAVLQAFTDEFGWTINDYIN